MEVEIVSDVFEHGCRSVVQSPKSALEILVSILGPGRKPQRRGAVRSCIHLYTDKIVLHWFACPGKEEAARAEMAAWTDGGPKDE